MTTLEEQWMFIAKSAIQKFLNKDNYHVYHYREKNTYTFTVHFSDLAMNVWVMFLIPEADLIKIR